MKTKVFRNTYKQFRWSSNYTSSRFYHLSYKNLQPPAPFLWIWNSKCCNKLRVFSWLLLMDRLDTRNILRRKKHKLEGNNYICVLCSNNVEKTAHHLFFSCPFSQEYWQHLGIHSLFGWLVRYVAGSWRSTAGWFVWEKNTVSAKNLRSFTTSHSQTNRLWFLHYRNASTGVQHIVPFPPFCELCHFPLWESWRRLPYSTWCASLCKFYLVSLTKKTGQLISFLLTVFNFGIRIFSATLKITEFH